MVAVAIPPLSMLAVLYCAIYGNFNTPSLTVLIFVSAPFAKLVHLRLCSRPLWVASPIHFASNALGSDRMFIFDQLFF